jgi:hypothetical protein
MHKSATKCNETIGKWCKKKHGASKIIDTLETYHLPRRMLTQFGFAPFLSHHLTAIDALPHRCYLPHPLCLRVPVLHGVTILASYCFTVSSCKPSPHPSPPCMNNPHTTQNLGSFSYKTWNNNLSLPFRHRLTNHVSILLTSSMTYTHTKLRANRSAPKTSPMCVHVMHDIFHLK